VTDVVLSGDIVKQIQLPSGGTVTFREPTDLRAKDKRRILKNLKDDNIGTFAGAYDLTDGVIMLLVESWSIPYLPNAPLPAELPEILGELTIADEQVLTNAAQPVVGLLFPKTTVDDAGVPGTPTRPASA
jgi:hypothetical protein